MGRLSRYKNTKKSVDDLSDVWGEGNNGRRKKKRSLVVQKIREGKRNRGFNVSEGGFDLPPTGEDEFDVHDMVGSLKKKKSEEESFSLNNKNKKESSSLKETVVLSMPKTITESMKNITKEETIAEAKKLRRNDNIALEKNTNYVEPRKKGESERAFYKRMGEEAKQIIRSEKIKESIGGIAAAAKREEEENNGESRKQKKKEFLQTKKNRKKNKKKTSDQPDIRRQQQQSRWERQKVEDDKEEKEEELSAPGYVAFGEQVERPPTFQVLPRGAVQKKRNYNSQEQKIAEMEKLREQAQAKYAQLKARRRNNGT
mmetsp:Transcript_725/g.858  ORF Transcript_725/g.858 Transcript_725/m.858 type:complete len:314 (+) Transcript_725:80-1021(+)|eukprot:CAMPEP_0194138614 /NCGR_PEP_ID=MMETSP0152-20130528/8368_1 /TAXON_ID=1049557 /ORGANISM="Thalassiothrix antarctica, Strain L6-D1" /LENGTH=313 /DNA_ID=CAMNT_0038836111 /DNA_START=38 /DNA_END=979 /DNA_ORIENTATION=-